MNSDKELIRRLGLGCLIVFACSAVALAQDPVPTSPAFSQLADTAEQQGFVRVIVGLRAAFTPAGDLPAQDVPVQDATIVNLQSALEAELRDTVLSSRRYKRIPFTALRVSPAGLTVLGNSPLVASIEEDKLSRTTLNVSTVRINANDAWAQGYSGAGQIVAILDTGVDKNHSFITPAKVIAEACFSTTDTFFGAVSICPNPNNNGDSEGVGTGLHCNPSGCKHGTHVAGIAAGKGSSFSGVARDAKIAAVQVFTVFNNASLCSSFGYSSPCVLSFTSDQLGALEWVYDRRNSYPGFKFAAVNMSLGGGRYTTQASCDADNLAVKAAIDNLRSVGVATVIAAGNSGYSNGLGAPGCISSAVSVGAVNDSDAVASFSNSASFLDLLAPGVGIRSSVPGNSFANLSGTSMATPHVAGAWAVLRGVVPSRSVQNILSDLRTTGWSITDGKSGITTSRIDVLAAARAAGSIRSDGFED